MRNIAFSLVVGCQLLAASSLGLLLPEPGAPASSQKATSQPLLTSHPDRYRLRTVVLDAGHGGKDIGCQGQDNHEADVALAIIKDLGRQIEDSMPGVRVIYTRKTDVFIELDERAAIANRNHADLFISVHCNAGPRATHGTEVWTMGLHKTDANLGVKGSLIEGYLVGVETGGGVVVAGSSQGQQASQKQARGAPKSRGGHRAGGPRGQKPGASRVAYARGGG